MRHHLRHITGIYTDIFSDDFIYRFVLNIIH